jgi:phage-related minor tail protein
MSDGDQLKLQLEVEVNSDPVVPGVNRVRQEMAKIGGAAKLAGDEASTQLTKVGDAVDREAAKTKRAVSSMANAFIRAQADIAAAASGRDSDRLKYSAQAKGVFDTEEVQKQYVILRKMEEAQAATAKGMNNMGMSAKQLQASMRGLPAQFTDIFTSLASGQSPMMVMIQQGGQIKDMFGGLVPALRAMGTALLGMINPWTVAAAAIGTAALAMYQASKEAKALNLALIDTGNAAGVTFSKLQQISAGIAGGSGGRLTQGASAEAIEAMVRAGVKGEESLRRFSAAAAEFERAGGSAVKEVAKNFAALADDPYKATMRLNEGMNFLTVEAWKTIAVLERQGQVFQAGRVAQEEYAKAMEQRTPQMLENLGYVEKAWLSVKDAAKKAWDAMLNVGRPGDDVVRITAEITALQAQLASPGASFNWGTSEGSQGRKDAEAQLKLLQEQLAVAKMVAGVDDAVARMKEQQAKQVAALGRLEVRSLAYRKEAEKLEADIVKMRWDGVEAGWTQLEIEKEEARMRAAKADKEKGPSGAENATWLGKEYEKAYLAAAAAATKLEAEQGKLNKSQEAILAFLKNPAFQQMPVPWQQAVLQILYASNAMEEANDSLAEFEKVWKSVSKSIGSDAEKYRNETKGINEKAKALNLERLQLGMTREAKRELSIVERELEIQRLEALVTSFDVTQQGAEAIKQIYDRIEALKKLNAAEKGMGAAEAANDAAKEWAKTAESIENALTDALMRGFEKGKGFAENLVDTIKNGMKTFVAKMIVKPVMGSLTNMVGSALGIPGAPGVGANGSGLLGSFLGSYGGTAAAGVAGAGVLGSAGAYGLLTGTSGAQAAQLAAQTGMFGAEGLSLTASAGGTALGGAASALMTAAPYLAAAYLAYSIWRGNKKNHQPAQQNYSQMGPIDLFSWAPNVQSSNAYDGTLSPIVDGVAATVKQLGGVVEDFTYGLYSSASPNGKGAQTVATLRGADGRVLYDYNVNGSNESMDQRLQDQIPRLFFAAMKESDLSQAFDDFFDQFDASAMTQEHLNTILEVSSAAQEMAESFKQLAGPFEQLTWLSVEARAGILDMVGGLDQFMQKVGGYFNDFYTEEERQAFALASVDETLTNVGLNPDDLRTKEDFRKMLEGIDASTPEGQRQYAAMINSAGAFSFGSGLLDATDMTLGEVTAGAPDSAGVDLMVTAQTTTNSLLERIEKAIRETGTASASRPIVVEVNVDQPASVEVYSGGINDGGGGP